MDKSYDHKTAERLMQQAWESEQTYAYVPADTSTGESFFSVDTPPPTVSGALHIGHIFSYTHADIIVRYQRMNGNSIFYPFGFDDNGLATERFVEKKRDVIAHQMARSDFIALCLEESRKSADEFKTLWQRMGLSVDWKQSYSTIDERSRRIAQMSFIVLYEKGYVYRKDEPALFCTACRTAVAQAELDDAEQQSVFYDVQFSGEDGTPLRIATTRPELLSSCVALFYNPGDIRYQHLKGKHALVPVFGKTVPILADEAVIIEKGTGLVMCCTFGDTTDITWYRKFKLPYCPSIGQDGRWLPSTGILAGLKGKQAREAMVAALAAQGALLGQKPITHSVSVHERCKHAIDFLILRQWFLKLLPYKQQLLACADEIAWHPAFMKARYCNWVENINWDWCLSRQRFYGVPFPVWHCGDCGHIIFAQKNQLPLDPQEVQYDGACPKCSGAHIVPDTDVMDTWNTSSLTPYICAGMMQANADRVFENTYTPMSVRPHAHDIIRTWTFYSIVKTWMHHGTVPWRNLMISGHVLSSEREKLSKSKENSPLRPENLLAAHPADAVRYWTASGTLGHDVAFSEGQLKIGNRLLVKLWNAFLFIKEHRGAPGERAALEKRGVINDWILCRAYDCFTQYKKSLDAYEFGLALDVVEKFFWHDVCDNYFEIIKDQFFNPQLYSNEQIAATRQTLHELGMRLLQLYAPFLPHITDSIYRDVYRSEYKTLSLHATQYTAIQTFSVADESIVAAELIFTVVAQLRKLKSEQQLSLRTELAELKVVGGQAVCKQLEANQAYIKGFARAGVIVYQPTNDSNLLEQPRLEQREGKWYASVVVAS